MKISVETYEDGAAAVRTDQGGFIPAGSEQQARTFAAGLKAGWDSAIYHCRRNSVPITELARAEIE